MNDLHSKIMNIRIDTKKLDQAINYCINTQVIREAVILGYKYGHRDARHAAAELANQQEKDE